MNMNSHICPTEIGVQPVCREEDDKTTTKHNKHDNPSFRSTSPTSRPIRSRDLQPYTYTTVRGVSRSGQVLNDGLHDPKNLQAFILECGRANGVLKHKWNITKRRRGHTQCTTAARLGPMTVRRSPAYSSISQESVERLHRALLGQIRTFKAQVERNYGITLNVGHGSYDTLVDYQPLRSTLRRLHQLRATLGKRAIVEFGETLLTTAQE